MKRVSILQKLENAGVIAVVRGKTKEEALKASQAIVAGGMRGIELTFTVPQATEVIQELVALYQENPDVVIGAGTVLDATTARLAIVAGAEYIVSPSFDEETAKICNLYQVPYLPGCMTITEMKEALKSGADIIKLFPGSVYAVSYTHLTLPTGGVSLENMAEWFAAGVTAVGVGGNLLAPAATGDFEKVREVAQAYMEKFQAIKGV